jgi:serine/threonine protein kinase HipA of HipAB toxin-antitoxin module
MAEPRKDLGENDVSFTDTISNVAEKVGDSISHAFHPPEQMRTQIASVLPHREPLRP